MRQFTYDADPTPLESLAPFLGNPFYFRIPGRQLLQFLVISGKLPKQRIPDYLYFHLEQLQQNASDHKNPN